MNTLIINGKTFRIPYELKRMRYKWNGMEFDVISITKNLDTNSEIYRGVMVE